MYTGIKYGYNIGIKYRYNRHNRYMYKKDMIDTGIKYRQ